MKRNHHMLDSFYVSQLGRFANDCLKLGRVAGLLLAIKSAREMLRRTREVFFRNATALHPELYELARKDCNSKSRELNSEHYFISPQYFREPSLPFNVLPTVLEELAQSLSLLHVRIDEFREFTVRLIPTVVNSHLIAFSSCLQDEGLLLKSLLLTLERDLLVSISLLDSGKVSLPPNSIGHHASEYTLVGPAPSRLYQLDNICTRSIEYASNSTLCSSIYRRT